MKIVLLGSRGQLGRCLIDQFSRKNIELISANRDQLDITNELKLELFLKKINPDVVINATAYTDVDKAESEKEIAHSLNHIAVGNLAKLCKKFNSLLFHYSTDYVFDGTSSVPYLETDKTNPKGIYGITKLQGEKLIRLSGCNYIIIRTSWVFSEYGKNFFKTMLLLAQKNDTIKVVNDQVGCPTYAQDIAKATIKIINKLKSLSHSEIYNFSGNEECTWFDFANEIFYVASKYNLRTPSVLKPVMSNEFISVAERPNYSVLNNNKIYERFDIKSSDWKKAIKKIIAKANNKNI